ncbi:hypothetical protein Mgra_00008352, partial [Meloidogyne graminicola]
LFLTRKAINKLFIEIEIQKKKYIGKDRRTVYKLKCFRLTDPENPVGVFS